MQKHTLPYFEAVDLMLQSANGKMT